MLEEEEIIDRNGSTKEEPSKEKSVSINVLLGGQDGRNRLPGPNGVGDTDEWIDSDPQCAAPDGYFAHPIFCDQYYMCTNGVSKLYRCPNGLIFNPLKGGDEVCDYPWDTKCSSGLATHDDRVHVSPKRHKTRTRSVNPTHHNIFTLFHFPAAFGYHIVHSAFSFPPKVHKETHPVVTIQPHPVVTGAPPQVHKETHPAGTIQPHSVVTGAPEYANSHCPRDWGLYPHETECGKFYNCANGHNYLMTCPPGLHFNPYVLVCDWPDNAKCAKVDDRYTCPKTSGFFPLQGGDCTQFILCIHNYPRLLSCSYGSFFDSTIGYCVKGYQCPSYA
ncbi:Protein obstructor-E [Nymphon striatum]|nr:Protein obstructor-E [Nymphon striatum]